jgi:hypothetical protein
LSALLWRHWSLLSVWCRQLLRWRADRHRTHSNILLWLTIVCVTALRRWNWTLIWIARSFLRWTDFISGLVCWHRMTLLSPLWLNQCILISHSCCCCAIWRSRNWTGRCCFTLSVWKLFRWSILCQRFLELRLLFKWRCIEVKICNNCFLLSFFRNIWVSIWFMDSMNFVKMSFLWTYWLCNQLRWWFEILNLPCYILLLVLMSIVIFVYFNFFVVI